MGVVGWVGACAVRYSHGSETFIAAAPSSSACSSSSRGKVMSASRSRTRAATLMHVADTEDEEMGVHGPIKSQGRNGKEPEHFDMVLVHGTDDDDDTDDKGRGSSHGNGISDFDAALFDSVLSENLDALDDDLTASAMPRSNGPKVEHAEDKESKEKGNVSEAKNATDDASLEALLEGQNDQEMAMALEAPESDNNDNALARDTEDSDDEFAAQTENAFSLDPTKKTNAKKGKTENSRAKAPKKTPAKSKAKKAPLIQPDPLEDGSLEGNEYADISPPEWYFVQVKYACEFSVKTSVENMMVNDPRVGRHLKDVIVPTKRVMKYNKRGNPMQYNELLFPNYVIIFVSMTRHCYQEILNVPHVQFFVGDLNREKISQSKDGWKPPPPLPKKEIEAIFEKVQASALSSPEIVLSFEPGELIEVKDGPFQGNDARVTQVDSDAGVVDVQLLIFGMESPIQLGLKSCMKKQFIEGK